MVSDWIKVVDPRYLSGELIGTVGSEMVVTIKDIDLSECFDSRTNETTEKMTLFFEETKPLVLNKTNAKALARLFDSPADSVGRKVLLKVEQIVAFGKQTLCIRIYEYSEETCPECGQPILPYARKSVKEIKEISKRNLGKVMCANCMKKAKKNE